MKRAVLALTAFLLPGLAAAQITASLAAMDGQVTIREAAGDQPGKLGRLLPAGAIVATGNNSSAVIAYSDGSKLKLGPLSQIKLDEQAANRIGVDLMKGLSDFWVSKVKSRRFRIKAGNSVASVRGTVVRAKVDDGQAAFSLFTGEISVTDSLGRSVILSPGQQVSVTSSGLGQMKTMSPSEKQTPEEPKVVFTSENWNQEQKVEVSGVEDGGDDEPESLPAPEAKDDSAPPSSPVQEKTAAPVSPSSP